MVTDSRPIRPRFDDETTVDEMTTQIPFKPSDGDIDIDGEALMTTIMDFIKDVSTESSIPKVDGTVDEGKSLRPMNFFIKLQAHKKTSVFQRAVLELAHLLGLPLSNSLLSMRGTGRFSHCEMPLDDG